MKTFTCDEVRAGLSDFLAGEGARHDANLIDVHLAGCALCRGHAEKLVWQDRVIAELSSRSRLEAMAGRVHAALESLDQVAVGEDGPARPRRWLAIAAAAVFLVAAGAAAVVLWPTPISNPVVVSPKKEPRPQPVPDVRKPDLPEPLPRDPDPAPKPPDVAPRPELPRPPVIVQNTPAPEAPKKPDPNIIQPETPKGPVVARDASKPAPSPQPDHVIEIVRPKSVEEALNRGVAFLRKRSPRLDFTRGGREPRPEELVLWTYFMAGIGEGDPEFHRLFKGILERKLERTYDVALQAMFLEELDRVKYQWRIHQCAQFLVDNQCRNGQWSYGEPSLFVDEIAGGPMTGTAGGPRPQVREFPASSSPYAKDKPAVKRKAVVVKRREGPESGDNSNSMYAALGLRACHDAGILLPDPVLRSAEKAWREAFNGEGWCYHPKGPTHRAYGSMTAGAAGSLVILDSIQGRDWRKDREVAAGMAWLAKNFTVAEHPGPSEHNPAPGWMHYYYMYALERAGILYGSEKIGSREWYRDGSQWLLDAQRLDGAWASRDGGNELNDTCFAILFLRRATRGLPPPVASK